MKNLYRHLQDKLYWAYSGDLYWDGQLKTDWWHDKKRDASSAITENTRWKRINLAPPPRYTNLFIPVLILGECPLEELDSHESNYATLLFLEIYLRHYATNDPWEINCIDVWLETVDFKVAEYRGKLGV